MSNQYHEPQKEIERINRATEIPDIPRWMFDMFTDVRMNSPTTRYKIIMSYRLAMAIFKQCPAQLFGCDVEILENRSYTFGFFPVDRL